MSCGLRQWCILSPLLFSLFITSVVTRLKEAEVGVKCGSKLISKLSYTDDAVIIAEDEKSMRLGSVGEVRGVIWEVAGNAYWLGASV